MDFDFSVISIGGGPAGLSFAVECAAQGFDVKSILVLEKGEHPIQAIRTFYPEKKMTIANYKNLPVETLGNLSVFPDLTKAQTLTYFDDLITKHGLNVRLKSEVNKIDAWEGGFRLRVGQDFITSKIVGIGIGILGRPNKPEYKIPNTLKSHILFDLTSQKVEGQKVLVVGGGDTSSEYCQVLVEDKNDVTLCYRGNSFTRMMDQNKTAAETLSGCGKLRVQLECDIVEIQDESGKPKAIFKNADKHPPEVFDKIIYAIGGTTPINFLKTCGIECDANWPKYGACGETNVRGLYLIGDLAVGKLGGSIITAYNSSFRAASHAVKCIGG